MDAVIAAGDPQTAAAGGEILRAGGNAVDAVVAASFASFVAESVLVNIGGGGMGMVYDAVQGESWSYDFFSAMPSRPMHARADFRQVVIDFGSAQQSFHIGRASVAVPGVVAGLCRMAAERGRLPLAHLLAPAIRLAEEGVHLSPALGFVSQLLTPIFTDTPQLAALFAPSGRMVEAGDDLRLPQLAHTFGQLGREGSAFFYTGTVGQAIVADQARHGGLITGADLANYRVYSTRPIQLAYREYTVLLPPPASSGGVLVAFALSLLARTDVAGLGHNSIPHLDLLARILAQTNVARREWEESVGPVAERIARFLTPERVDRHLQALLSTSPGPAMPFPEGHRDTTHISVMDQQGQIAAVTTSAGENAGFVVGETGVCLNNMLGEADLHPQGFHRLAAGERLTTMMCPTIVLAGGEAVLALGSGGSSRIRSAILQSLSNVLDFGLPLAEAIDAPRIHVEAGVVQVEGGIPQAVTEGLGAQGHVVNGWPNRNMYFGGVHGVARQQGKQVAAGDSRRGGAIVSV